MKKQQQLLPAQLNALGKFLSLVMMILLCGPAVFAQDYSQMDSRDPMVVFLHAHRDSPFVKYLTDNPDDGDAMKMVKTQMIVENPEQFPDFSVNDIDRLKSDLKGYNEKVNYVNEQVAKGDTREMALARYQRLATAPQRSGEMNVSIQNSVTPAISAPAQGEFKQ